MDCSVLVDFKISMKNVENVQERHLLMQIDTCVCVCVSVIYIYCIYKIIYAGTSILLIFINMNKI